MKSRQASFSGIASVVAKTIGVILILCIGPFGIANSTVAAADAEVTVTDTTIAVVQNGAIKNSRGLALTQTVKYLIEVNSPGAGQIDWTLVNSTSNASGTVVLDVAQKTIGDIELKEGINTITIKYTPVSKPAFSRAFDVVLDTTGPILENTTPRWNDAKTLLLNVDFNEDLKPPSTPYDANTFFTLKKEKDANNFAIDMPLTGKTATFFPHRIQLNLGELPRGNYQLAMKSGEIKDLLSQVLDAASPTEQVVKVFAPSLTTAPQIAFATPDLPKTDDGVRLKNQNPLKLTISNIPNRPGTLRIFVNGSTVKTLKSQELNTNPFSAEINLTNEGHNTISAAFTDTATDERKTSQPLKVIFDTIGPLLQHVELVSSPSKTGTESTLLATFAADDFKGDVKTASFQVDRLSADGTPKASPVSPNSAVIEGRTIRLGFTTPLDAGEYQLTVRGVDSDALVDEAGNRAGRQGSANVNGKNQNSTFSVLGQRQFGQHVEFTPYAPPKKQPIPEEGFNPGDYVETRVARLFYFRDAHRVAQIINRNIRSYNQAAVTHAERRAEKSRDNADDATDERREKERAAVQAAEQARTAERKLAQAQQTVAEATGLQNSNTAATTRVTQIRTSLETPGISDQEKAALAKEQQDLQIRTSQNQVKLDQIGDIDQLTKSVAGMEQSVANLRETELAMRNEWNNAQAKEARARATQFRDEVSAAEEDPDTFVAGDMNSVDPVTQCSISVIGEGLIQLRGPIKGINTIRTMINQIDSPVGQIKIGIFSVQVNGEEGDKMEKVIGDAESNIDLSRFLVNQSLNLLRRAIQSEASIISEQCQLEGHYQVDRDRRYLYAFFGRDFIDELYEMNSEFLFTENKLLSLHAMDTVSLNRALFILALAKNDVRDRIVTRFLESTKTELPDAEFDYRRSGELKPHRTQKFFPPWNLTRLPIKNRDRQEQVIHEAVHRNALQRYHFRNFSAFFDTGFTHSDTMNPMQREFIRLAQIFKARLVAEMEWKQRVMERGLIEDRSNDETQRAEILRSVHKEALEALRQGYLSKLESVRGLAVLGGVVSEIDRVIAQIPNSQRILNHVDSVNKSGATANQELWDGVIDEMLQPMLTMRDSPTGQWMSATELAELNLHIEAIGAFKGKLPGPVDKISFAEALTFLNRDIRGRYESEYRNLKKEFEDYRRVASSKSITTFSIEQAFGELQQALKSVPDSGLKRTLRIEIGKSYRTALNSAEIAVTISQVDEFLDETRGPLDHRKLLNHLIDEQEEKFIELVEGTRSHIAVMDQYLKRLSIALEDDFKVQFYDPAFVRVREAARGRSVNLSQVERTTILTNNRAFAKVDPQATMEFDLPKRQIAIKEAFDAAKALVEDTGALVNDPTFLSAFQMMGGSKQASTVKNVVPGQSMSTDQQTMGLVPPQPDPSGPGSALQSLVPEPSIYKLETGTGFQIRPVMQPDGDSAVYDFDYMYTTNIREPVRADEKHVGRIKRHYVHTAVQTGNFELREISRYQVALKVSRTGQGVPLLQDIPLLGIAFRPAPSDESSLQQNIIFGQTNIYPTLYDLMGLRWAQQVVDLDHTSLLETEHVIRGRQKSMKDYVFRTASERVDKFLDVKNPRADFYHPQTLSSPHHPGGYNHQYPAPDPTGNNYERFDRRPPEMQEPPYDRYRHVPVHPERIGPQIPPPLAPAQGDVRNTPMQRNGHLAPANRNTQAAQIRASDYWAPAPKTETQQFQSFLLEGPDQTATKSAQPRINDDASTRVPTVGRNQRSQFAMIEGEQSFGSLKKQLTPPTLAPLTRPGIHHPVATMPSGVVPASFEQQENQRRPQIRRLPPVTR